MGKVTKKLEDQKQTGSTDFICDIHGKEFLGYGRMNEICCTKCEDLKKTKRLFMSKIFEASRNLALPKRLKKCTFESYIPQNKDAENISKKCKQFCSKLKISGGLILIGSVGTGKTHLAISICQKLCGDGISCIYTTVSRIVRIIKSTWSGKGRVVDSEFGFSGEIETEEDVVKRYANYPLLVIDEIGSQYGSDTERIVISEIINDRYNHMLPTIIIGNVTFSEVQESIGKRAVDRICDNGQVFIFNWDSYRKQAS